MPIQVGDRIPEGTLRHMTPSGPADISTSEVFGGKKVVLFSVPGAFTPTCSSKHLPSYINNYASIKAKGFDTIACMSVNDVFVMDAWGKGAGAEGKVLMLADGNADYARTLGLDLDLSKAGMGTRGKRFSMVVENGVVKEMHIEAPGKYEVSGAEPTCGV
jgi:glutaredoxin/glutathione-dependent peroxiredoxin